MPDVGGLLKRQERQMSKRVADVDAVWRECFDYTFPLRGNGIGGSITSPISGQVDKQARQMDSTAPDAANTLAANIMGGLTPSNSVWFALDVGEETTEERTWLDDSAKLLWENIHMANFDAEGFECALDMVAAGMFALYVDEDRERGGFAFQQWPLGQCTFASTRVDGLIDIVHRRYSLTAGQAAKEFGREHLSEATQRMLDAGRDGEDVEFLHVIEPRGATVRNPRLSQNLPVGSYHIEVAAKRMVRESGFHEMPVIVPRWLRVPDSIYAVGPMFAALPDVRQLNTLKGFELAAADVAISGMWVGVDDGVLNPRNLKLGPRKVVIAADTDNIKALQSGANFELSDVMAAKLQESIRRTLMADVLPPADGPTKTAFEYSTRVDLARKIRAPIYGRLQAEYLGPLVVRCFGLAFRAGVFTPPPESLAGRSFSVRYVSPLARAQKLDEVQAVQGTIQTVGAWAEADPTVLDLINFEKGVEVVVQGLNAPGAIMRSPREVAKLREARAQAQQQQAQQQAAQQAQAAGMEAGAVRMAEAAT